MRILPSVVVTVTALVVPALSMELPADAPYRTSMSMAEWNAFQQVSKHCQRDVELFCDAPPLFMQAFMMPPPIQDMSLLLDSLMDQALSMPFVIEVDLTSQNPLVEEEDAQTGHVMSQMAAHTPVAEFEDTTERIQEHGNKLLQDETVAVEKRRMARRLTEVSSDDLHHHRQLVLPFGCPHRNACLQDAHQQGVTSPDCRQAMNDLSKVRLMQTAVHQDALERQVDTMVQLTFLYLLALITLVVLYCKRRALVPNRRLRMDVLQAIYSTPSLKAAVEDELGESIGAVPPLRWTSLYRFGAYRNDLRAFLCATRWLRACVACLLMTLLWTAPTLVLPVCLAVIGYVLLVLLVCPTPVRQCTCCCCGVSTMDVQNGTVSQEQACCNCCRGTGVCNVNCASCCGNGDDDSVGCGCDPCCTVNGYCSQDGCCCCCACCCSGQGGCCQCCSDGCTCCTKDACCNEKKEKETKKVEHVIYEGIPVQIV